MTPEQISAIFVGTTGVLTAGAGLVLAWTRRRDNGAAEDRLELKARDAHEDEVAAWRVQMRSYVARLREMLSDRGVETETPPPFPERKTPGKEVAS